MSHSRFVWLLPVLAMAGCEPFDPWFEYAADDPNLRFIGRKDSTADPDSQGPIYAYSGGTIRLRCDCTGVDVAFKDLGQDGDENTNWVNVIVDGEEKAKVELQPGKQVLLHGARNLKKGEHVVEIVKRTGAYAGRIQFLGVSLQGLLLEQPPRPEKKIEVIGDSLTCGYGNEVRIYAPNYTEPETGYHSKNEDISKAYGSLLARRFNAELMTTCIKDTGIYRNPDGTTDPTKTFPGLYLRIFPYQEDSPVWKTKDFVPDLILINLGKDDFNAIAKGGTLPSAQDEKGFKDAYAAFVQQLRKYYPSAKIVCTVGPMMNDNYPAGAKHWTLIQRWVEAMVTELGDPNVYYFRYTPIADPYGEDWHPTAESHAQMAEEIAPFLESLGF